ncbi:hypothetical protein BV22DRAFT_1041855 [Leucogyrophana mollusca]|uniref:Uncharacterized protein n=1 Tax=Leucogyrophana mollusca TaxID=85980 RepID=A0ACB8B0T0_9AGAM|nr:hypothetical protein BV22DRAFT_1041855 [Leucogyrophana mollusca]
MSVFTRAVARTSAVRPIRSIHTTLSVLSAKQSANTEPHIAENYFKDVDETPPQDPTIHRVDAGSEAAQRPHEPPSGQWSQAGAETGEYKDVSREDPYDVPTAQPGKHGPETRLRYGGTKRYAEDKGEETSRPGEGPEGSEKGGRKPEGR